MKCLLKSLTHFLIDSFLIAELVSFLIAELVSFLIAEF